MKNSKKSIIDLLEENESKVGKLYEIYSRKIKGHGEFWKKIAEEEFKHAEEVRKTRNTSGNEFAENGFSRKAIEYAMNFVKDEIKKARSSKISHFDAIIAALRIEQSILESKDFDFFHPKNMVTRRMMEKLNRETDKHVKILRKEIKKLKI